MKRINLFSGDDCVGSIYFGKKNNIVILDLEGIQDIFDIGVSGSWTEAERFEQTFHSYMYPDDYELSIFRNGRFEDGYKLIVDRDTVSIYDNAGKIVFKTPYDDSRIEDMEEWL